MSAIICEPPWLCELAVRSRPAGRLVEQRRDVRHPQLRTDALDTIVEHHGAERTRNRECLRAGAGRLAATVLVYRLGALLHPHVRAAGAAAERLLPVALHLDRLADRRHELPRWREHVVVAGQVARVVVGDVEPLI